MTPSRVFARHCSGIFINHVYTKHNKKDHIFALKHEIVVTPYIKRAVV